MLSVAFLTLASAAVSVATNLYVSSYEGVVHTVKLKQGAGDLLYLEPNATTAGCASSPSWLELDGENRILYCIDEGLQFPQPAGSLSSYNIQENGILAQQNRFQTVVAGPVHGVLYKKGDQQAMAMAHYSGSSITNWKVSLEGDITFLTNVTFTMDSPGPNEQRQEAPHEHQALIDPTGNFLLFPDLGADLVRVFSVDEHLNMQREEPLAVEPGSGPRHAAFWQADDESPLYLFVVTELANTLTSYAVTYPEEGGMAFEEKFVTNTFGGETIPEGAAAAEIQVAPSNDFILISNRNDSSFMLPNIDPTNSTLEESDSIASFRPSAADGSLEFVQLTPAGGLFPRHFSLNAAGDVVAIALQRSSRVVLMARDVHSGEVGNPVGVVELEGELTAVIWDEF